MSQFAVSKPSKSEKSGSAETVEINIGNDRPSDTAVSAIFEAAKRSGLLDGKTGRITGRISPALVAQAKKRTGIGSDSRLIEYALASVALEDNFAAAFRKSRGTIDPTLDLGF